METFDTARLPCRGCQFFLELWVSILSLSVCLAYAAGVNPPTKRFLWSFVVVFQSPLFDELARMRQIPKPILIRTVVYNPLIERLDVSVLVPSPAFDGPQNHNVPVSESQHCLTGKVLPVIRPNDFGEAASLRQVFVHLDHQRVGKPLASLDPYRIVGCVLGDSFRE